MKDKISKYCKKYTSDDCGDYDDCEHGHNYIGKKKSKKNYREGYIK